MLEGEPLLDELLGLELGVEKEGWADWSHFQQGFLVQRLWIDSRLSALGSSTSCDNHRNSFHVAVPNQRSHSLDGPHGLTTNRHRDREQIQLTRVDPGSSLFQSGHSTSKQSSQLWWSSESTT